MSSKRTGGASDAKVEIVATGRSALAIAAEVVELYRTERSDGGDITLEARQGLHGLETIVITILGAVVGQLARAAIEAVTSRARRQQPPIHVVVVLGGIRYDTREAVDQLLKARDTSDG